MNVSLLSQFRTAECLFAICSLSVLGRVPWLLLCAQRRRSQLVYVTIKHQLDDHLHRANLLKQTFIQLHKTVVRLLNSVFKPPQFFTQYGGLKTEGSCSFRTPCSGFCLCANFSPTLMELHTTEECDRSASSSSYTSGKTK